MALLVTYGSETGNAREMAEYLYRECLYRNLRVEIAEMNCITLNQLPTYQRTVFVCSTTGDGEEPKNMKQFWRSMLSRQLRSDHLANMEFAVLGLGDSSYAKFNYVAKRLHRRLIGLGGIPIHTLGLCDEQHPEGADYQCYIWIDELFADISSRDHVTYTRAYQPLPPKYTISITPANLNTSEAVEISEAVKISEVVKTDISNDNGACTEPITSPDKDSPFPGVLVGCERVTSSDHFQDVRLISLDISGSGMTYQPGDVVWIYPENTTEDVEEACRLLRLSPDDTVHFTGEIPSRAMSRTMSVREVLTRHLDIASVPGRRFFEICSQFATDELEREKFEEFTSLMGREELYSYVSRPRRTILEVLGDFHSVRNNLDISYLLDIIPPIRPRGFSIASAQCVHPDRLEICVGVVRYRTVMKKDRIGLCSNWLANLTLGSPVRLYIERGSFHFPTDRPIIMVGPGTGCAPFRSLIQSRVNSSQTLLLFFGCREEKSDYFFKHEWEQSTPARGNDEEEGERGVRLCGDNLRVVTAFSRDQESKIYVQHRIVEHGELVWKLVSQGAVFCVAGNSKNMPFQVKDALAKVISTHGKVTNEESNKFIDQLVKNKLYQTETW